MSGFVVLSPEVLTTAERDYTTYDAYINDLPMFFAEGEGARRDSESVPLQVARMDTGNRRWETRPETGDHYGQGDFSRGQGQEYFDRQGSDEAAYYYGEGLDIERVGHVSVLNDLTQIAGIAAPLSVELADGKLFSTDGTTIRHTTDLAVWTNDSPHGAEAAVTVLDLASNGDDLFAACGGNGVHKRTGATDTWAHWKPDGVADLAIGTVTKVKWLRGRLWAVGNAGRQLYEISNDSTPPTLGDILPAGWEYTSLWEAGDYVYAAAVSLASKRSRIYHFGLSSAAVPVFEPKGESAPLPRGTLCYAGVSELGKTWLVGGRHNKDGGYDPVWYQASADGSGYLFLEGAIGPDYSTSKVAGSADLSARAIEPIGESLLASWSLGTGNPFGNRVGLAEFNFVRGSFAHSFSPATVPVPVQPPLDIVSFNGRTVFITADGLYAEHLTRKRTKGEIYTSVVDRSNSGAKVWDKIEVAHLPLPIGTSIEVYYSTKHPEKNEWTPIGVSKTAGEDKSTFYLDNIRSTFFVIKLVLRSDTAGTASPTLVSLTARSNPSPDKAEWTRIVTFRIVHKDRKNEYGEWIYTDDPDEKLASIEAFLYTWVSYYEQHAAYKAQVTGMRSRKYAEPPYEGTSGEADKNAWEVELKMVGTREGIGSADIRLA